MAAWAWRQAVPDDEIAAEFAAALPEEERERALRAVPGARPAPPPRRPRDLAEVARLTRPVALAREQTLPVAGALEGLLPWSGGLPRGTTVTVGSRSSTTPGATSLAFALAAEASAAGSWVAVVGLPALGVAAAAEVGVALERLAVIAEPEPDAWPATVAALIGAFDVVLVGRLPGVGAGAGRRLAARARERGTVLVEVPAAGEALGPASGSTIRSGGLSSSSSPPSASAASALSGRRSVPSVAGPPVAASSVAALVGPARPLFDADLRLTVTAARWFGVGQGHGSLRSRQLRVEASGRRGADRPRRLDLWLLDPEGRLAVVADDAATSAGGSGSSVGDEVGAVRRERRRALARTPLVLPSEDDAHGARTDHVGHAGYVGYADHVGYAGGVGRMGAVS